MSKRISLYCRHLMLGNVEKRIFELLDPLYEMGTTGSSRGWSAVLREMSDIFKSGPAALVCFSPGGNSFDVLAATYSDQAVSDAKEKFRLVAPFVSVITKKKPGLSFWRKRDRPDDEFLKSEIYRE